MWVEEDIMKVGSRVGAIFGSNDNMVDLIGFGIYLGDFVPHLDVVGFMGESMRELNIKNPKISLDSDQDVYGCECWWGSEDVIKEFIGNRTVDIDELREKYKNND